MSGGFPLFGGYANASSYVMAPSPGAANTKGAWSQLVASLPHDVGAILIDVPAFFNSSVNLSAIDIGVGASGSEVSVINNLVGAIDGSGYATQGTVAIPITIPAGSRVSCRVQTSSGAGALSGGGSIILFDTNFIAPTTASIIDSLGFNATNTEGASITPATSSPAYGTIVSSTSHDYLGFFAIFDPQVAYNAQNFVTTVDIAVGGSGSEKIILPSYALGMRPGSGFSAQTITPIFFVPIPAGSRLSARALVDSAATGTMGVTLYGLRA